LDQEVGLFGRPFSRCDKYHNLIVNIN
jgi:hypothetical protein